MIKWATLQTSKLSVGMKDMSHWVLPIGNKACHPGGHYWNAYPGVLKCYSNHCNLIVSWMLVDFNKWQIDLMYSQITRSVEPTWGPPGSCRAQMGPMLAPWTLLSGLALDHQVRSTNFNQMIRYSQWWPQGNMTTGNNIMASDHKLW